MTEADLGSFLNSAHLATFVNFRLSEKHTKLEKNLRHGFDKSADLLSKHQIDEEVFFKSCVLLKMSELYEKLSEHNNIS